MSASMIPHAQAAPALELAHDASLYFADESDNNAPTFDAKAYHSAGHRVYASKATQGTSGSQPPYVERVTAAHDAGLKVVHYHFADPGEGDPVGQMEFFLKTIDRHFHEGDRAVLDVEWEADSTAATTEWAHAAFGYLHAHGHPGAPLYTGLSFLQAHGKDLVPPSGSLWVADYGRPGESLDEIWTDVERTLPAGHLWALQYTDGENGPEPHTLPGIGGPCDVSKLAKAL